VLLDLKPQLNTLNQAQKVVFEFNGLLDFEISNSLMSTIKTQIVKENVRLQSLYGISVEMIENCIRHRNDANSNVGYYIFDEEKYLKIITTNAISIEDYNRLTDKLAVLNHIDLIEIKEIYKRKMLSNVIGSRGTAGVGLELIRLKSKNSIFVSKIDENNVMIEVKFEK
jgi:hypothetical protein